MITPHAFKVILIGAYGQGKSSLVRRHFFNSFTETEQATMGCDFHTYKSHSGRRSIEVWDTAGGERFKSLTKMYLRGCDLVLCCCECNDVFALDQLTDTIKYCKDVSPGVKFILVITKMDKYLEPSLADIERRWPYEKSTIMYTSANTGEGITELFDEISKIADENLNEFVINATHPSKKVMGNLNESLLEHPVKLKKSYHQLGGSDKKKCCVIS